MASGRTKTLLQSILLFFIFLGFSSFISDDSVSADGNVSFSVKTVTYNGDRSPKNIVAIWIEDISGNFVKTKLLQANTRKQWLLTWNAKSKGSTVDAITGPTLSNHQSTHTIEWDCTDETGSKVVDGEYKIVVEFTEAHSQGPITSVSFTKGPVSQTITPGNETNFIDMKLEYTLDATGITSIPADNPVLGIYPNPFAYLTTIFFSSSEINPVRFKVYGLNGTLLREMKYLPGSIGEQSLQWDGTNNKGEQVPPGVYFLQIQLKDKMFCGQVLKIKR